VYLCLDLLIRRGTKACANRCVKYIPSTQQEILNLLAERE
jgi:hypothetical protein